MRVTRVSLRDFRNIERAELDLGEGMSVVHGPNGAGKTNLLEGLYFGLAGRSCRTHSDRDLVRFGAPTARVEVTVEGEDGRHLFAAAVEPGTGKRLQVDGAPAPRGPEAAGRPLLSVFLPDRLALVKGAPGARRAHLDRFVAALWPARADHRRRYAAALAQRNALLGRIRAGRASPDSLAAWDLELGARARDLAESRRDALAALAECFAAIAAELGLAAAELRYAARGPAASPEDFAAELAARREADLARGFTGHGPHRDDLALSAGGRSLRRFGSQGQQRTALLALLLAERAVLARSRSAPPLMLLDDVLSELDAERRRLLVERLSDGGQALLTATDLAQMPDGLEYRAVAFAAGRTAAVLEVAR